MRLKVIYSKVEKESSKFEKQLHSFIPKIIANDEYWDH